MSKIVIFGSTGMTGLCAVEAALKKGLEVRAFVRDPAKMPAHLKDKVEIFQGNVLEPDSVADAVEDMDGVVVALGTRNALEPTSDMSEGTKNIIDAMRAKKCQNTVGLSVCFLVLRRRQGASEVRRPERGPQENVRSIEAESFELDRGCSPPHIADEPSREIVVQVNPKQSPGRVHIQVGLGILPRQLSQRAQILQSSYRYHERTKVIKQYTKCL
ncbi:hypothetical protein ACJJTC_001145 [Scirpophaga incertulas]